MPYEKCLKLEIEQAMENSEIDGWREDRIEGINSGFVICNCRKCDDARGTFALISAAVSNLALLTLLNGNITRKRMYKINHQFLALLCMAQ